MINSLADNRQAYWWNASPSEAIDRAQRLFGPTILVEAGTSIIMELLELALIDRLELSVSTVTGGKDPIDIKKLLSYFTSVTSEVEGETTFHTATR
jgi:dihydrofolate reductase